MPLCSKCTSSVRLRRSCSSFLRVIGGPVCVIICEQDGDADYFYFFHIHLLLFDSLLVHICHVPYTVINTGTQPWASPGSVPTLPKRQLQHPGLFYSFPATSRHSLERHFQGLIFSVTKVQVEFQYIGSFYAQSLVQEFGFVWGPFVIFWNSGRVP